MNKIAVTYADGQIFQHFGHTEYFLKEHGVQTLICGGIGGGAKMALAQAGITLYGGASGDADTAVQNLLDGILSFNPDVMCSHHSHGAGHTCGNHGNHSCGNH